MQRLIVILDASVQATANRYAQKLAGGNAFVVGLSPSGNAPATHYWCSWDLSDRQARALLHLLHLWLGQGRVLIFDAELFAPNDVLAAVNLKRLAPETP